MPAGVVYVGRPHRLGNEWTKGDVPEPHRDEWRRWVTTRYARELSDWLNGLAGDYWRAQLDTVRGRSLACWCPLDQPCHADVLLALANPADHECDGGTSWCWPCEYRQMAAPMPDTKDRPVAPGGAS